MKKIILVLAILVAILAGVLLLVPRDNGLVITRSAISLDENGKQVISGTVENQTDKTYSQVQVNVTYLNANKKVVGRDSFETNSLGSHMVWGFKEYVKSESVSSFKIKVSSPQIFGLRW